MSGERDDHDLLIEIKTKLDMLVAGDVDKEKRIRALEAFRWKLVGLSVAAGGAADLIMQAITHR